jgi:hypothetical protein
MVLTMSRLSYPCLPLLEAFGFVAVGDGQNRHCMSHGQDVCLWLLHSPCALTFQSPMNAPRRRPSAARQKSNLDRSYESGRDEPEPRPHGPIGFTGRMEWATCQVSWSG